MSVFKLLSCSESQGEGRAFLLPLLASRTTNTRLSHFTNYFVPLSEKLFELQSKATENGKEAEARIWETLIGQIWTTFKGYCDVCTDLPEVCAILELCGLATDKFVDNRLLRLHSLDF
jgi:hypothetical protein